MYRRNNFIIYKDLVESGFVTLQDLAGFFTRQDSVYSIPKYEFSIYVIRIDEMCIEVEINVGDKILNIKRYFNHYSLGRRVCVMKWDFQKMREVLERNKKHYNARLIQKLARGMLTRRKVHFALMNIHVDPDALRRNL